MSKYPEHFDFQNNWIYASFLLKANGPCINPFIIKIWLDLTELKIAGLASVVKSPFAWNLKLIV